MFLNTTFHSLRKSYIIFFLALLFIILNTSKVHSSIFKVSDIQITEPFNPNFKKQEVINKAILLGFRKLLSMTISTNEMYKISGFNADEIKNLIDSFTIKDEKFINNKYNATFEINFNKQNTFLYVEKKNIYPSIPKTKEIFLFPIFVDSVSQTVNVFNQNPFYREWNKKINDYHLLNYILPSEDIDIVKVLNDNFNNLEVFDYSQITKNYNIDEYIICLIYTNQENFKVFSKIKLNQKLKIKSFIFPKKNISSSKILQNFINAIKLTYEDEWKKINQINRSVKLPINLSISSDDFKKNQEFKKFLSSTDLVSNFMIKSFNNSFVNYKIIFNGSPKQFLNTVENQNFLIDTNEQIWKMK